MNSRAAEPSRLLRIKCGFCSPISQARTDFPLLCFLRLWLEISHLLISRTLAWRKGQTKDILAELFARAKKSENLPLVLANVFSFPLSFE